MSVRPFAEVYVVLVTHSHDSELERERVAGGRKGTEASWLFNLDSRLFRLEHTPALAVDVAQGEHEAAARGVQLVLGVVQSLLPLVALRVRHPHRQRQERLPGGSEGGQRGFIDQV
eukprot:1181626-Prorocentrum_minimum.AAC.1